MSQTTSADEALGVWVATEQFKGDRLYRAVGIRWVLKTPVSDFQWLKNKLCILIVQL